MSDKYGITNTKMIGKLTLSNCRAGEVVMYVDLPEKMKGPARISLDRSVLPDDFEPALYEIGGSITVNVKVKKTLLKMKTDEKK